MASKISKFLQSVDESQEFWNRVFFLWLLGDVAYTVLPIGVILMIDSALNRPLNNFMRLPEWSFASIILFGLSIRYLVRLKTKYQKDLSYKLDSGIQILVLSLIASVICLSLIILKEGGASTVNQTFLTTVQMGLFFLGLACLFISTYFTEKFLEEKEKLPQGLSKGRYLRHLEDSLNSANKSLRYFVYALDKSEVVNVENASQLQSSKVWNEESKEKLEIALQKIERSVREARQLYNQCEIYSPHLNVEEKTDHTQQA